MLCPQSDPIPRLLSNESKKIEEKHLFEFFKELLESTKGDLKGYVLTEKRFKDVSAKKEFETISYPKCPYNMNLNLGYYHLI